MLPLVREDLNELVLGGRGQRDIHDLARASLDGRRAAHDALANGGHLRERVGAHDGRYDVAAEGRAYLQEFLLVAVAARLVIADLQIRAVCREACARR